MISRFVAVAVIAPLLSAQATLVGTPGEPRPSFEIASVKWIDRTKMERNHEGHLLTPRRFVERTELMQLVSIAYVIGDACTLKTAQGADCSLIEGEVPSWAKTERFEIQATLPAGAVSETPARLHSGDPLPFRLMLQVLLEDRFRLRVHRETRQLPVYALTVGKDGPKLKPPTSEPLRLPDGTSREIHGMRVSRRIAMPDGTTRQQMTFQATSLAQVANFFGESLDVPVVNRTGLDGEYDFVIEYEVERAPAAVGRPASFLPGATASELQSAFRAIGLQLEPTRVPLEILVIDHVERPSEN